MENFEDIPKVITHVIIFSLALMLCKAIDGDNFAIPWWFGVIVSIIASVLITDKLFDKD